MNRGKYLLFLSLMCLPLAGCSDFWGRPTNLNFLNVPFAATKPAAFVPVQPIFKNLSYPTDVCAGYDNLIYVADAGVQQIVCYDQAGNRLGSFTVPGLKTVKQDRQLDLLAIGTYDTIVSGIKYTFAAIYRIEQKNSVYGLQEAYFKNIIIHPFYYKNSFSATDPAVNFNDIAILADNSYYVTRSGTSNSSNQFGGPDNNVLYFSSQDQFLTTILISTSTGTYSDYFQKPFGITTLAQPPQSTYVSTSTDFIYTSQNNNAPLKVQYITQEATSYGVSNVVKDFTPDTFLAKSYIYKPYRFTIPAHITVDGSGTGDIFVADEGSDSIYIFLPSGIEGVNPESGSTSKKAVYASFGGFGNSPSQFNKPMGVAYLNDILYVADAGNGCIKRFKLTYNFQ